MIIEDFTIQGHQRLEELEDFLKIEIPDASMRSVPHQASSQQTFEVSIRYSMQYASKLDQLHSKWKKEDAQAAPIKSEGIFQSIFTRLKLAI